MRPLHRPDWPKAHDGNNKVYSDYKSAKDDLIHSFGMYCAYCERKASFLTIDHVIPQSQSLELIDDWNNFLLACHNCNPTKRNRNISREEYLWPDEHNTFIAYRYDENGCVYLNENISENINRFASNTYFLVGLNKVIEHDPRRKDDRTLERRDAWKETMILQDSYNRSSNDVKPSILPPLLTIARKIGYFSIWMKVFEGYPNIRNGLIRIFTGTCPASFDLDTTMPLPKTSLGI